nr:bifunctional precorrin-2 dehydrogenase/sirohydrochlorin ferrochelatase [Enterovirga sp. DB1703]
MTTRRPTETLGAGLEPLAVLPVFLRLRGKRAVVAGGDAGALWKARLLSAAGAEVDVFSPAIARELRPDAIDGPILLHEREWDPADLDGAAFGVAALPEEASCAAFVAAARARGVPVNAVDRPHLCDLQFGAVVNRSPLVGISTGGAAPILAQRVRSEIESLFPRGLAGWVAAAARWRERVGAAFVAGARRLRRAYRRRAGRSRAPDTESGGPGLRAPRGEDHAGRQDGPRPFLPSGRDQWPHDFSRQPGPPRASACP